VLLREEAVGGLNITGSRGDGHPFLVTMSLLMALLYTIYRGCTNKGDVYLYTHRNKGIRVICTKGKMLEDIRKCI
jgi:hypothetical protein